MGLLGCRGLARTRTAAPRLRPGRGPSRPRRRRGSTSRPPQRPQAASEPSGSRCRKKPGRGASARNEASDEKRRGFSMYGPPSSGQKTSQLPQSLQASAQFAIWCGDDFAPPSASVRSPRRDEPSALDDEVAVGDRSRRGLVDEVRVVRADGDALVAVDAVEEVRGASRSSAAAGPSARPRNARRRAPRRPRGGGSRETPPRPPPPGRPARAAMKSGSVAAPASPIAAARASACRCRRW